MQTPRSRRFTRVTPGLSLLGAGTLLALAGCFDNDPGLQERLVRIQAELQDKSRRVQELETALEKARADARDRPTAPPATETAPAPVAPAAIPAMLTREQLEETYVVAAKEMRQKVESGVTGYAVEKCTLFKVDMPSVALPYTSKVALNLRSSAGQPYRLEFPVGADWSGKWAFPTPGDVSATLEKASAQAPAGSSRPPAAGSRSGSTASAGAPNRPSGRAAEGPANTSVETIEMSWGGRRSPGVAAPRQPAPPEAPASAAGGRTPPVPAGEAPPTAPGNTAGPPRPAMQSERDVLIQF